jgi:hypothetical protein
MYAYYSVFLDRILTGGRVLPVIILLVVVVVGGRVVVTGQQQAPRGGL